jgi:hypothetical protein
MPPIRLLSNDACFASAHISSCMEVGNSCAFGYQEQRNRQGQGKLKQYYGNKEDRQMLVANKHMCVIKYHLRILYRVG